MIPEFDTQIDEKPVAWQFLQNLRMDDLPSELVQNELDAGSLETRLTFGKTQFTCEGTGEPIDADGWKRLALFLGAGSRAPRKRNKTGVKDHGLKTCFTLGDHIWIRSDRKRLVQTLYRYGEKKPPWPASYKFPIPDESAPTAGCRIEVPYRTAKLVPQEGEFLSFGPVGEHEIEALFTRLVSSAARHFLGVIRPGFRDSYTLVVTHWKLGAVTFQFTSRRLSSSGKGLLFARTCQASTPDAIEVASRSERAFVFPLRLSRQALGEVPECFAWGRGACAEISWTIDSRGQPIADRGMYRYPLTYPDDIEAGRTGLGVFYSAPFKSDSFRHGLASQSSELNAQLIAECDRQLVHVLQTHLMPRFGPSALSINCDAEEPDSSRALQVVGQVVASGAIPIVPKRRGTARKKVSQRVPYYSGKRSLAGKEYAFIIPVHGGELSPVLAAANTTGFSILDPRTPSTVFSLLLSQDCAGWGKSYIYFDWVRCRRPTTGTRERMVFRSCARGAA